MKGILKRILQTDEAYELSGTDIQNAIGIYPITYDKLANMQNINDLFAASKNDMAIILYLSSWNSGHYTALWRNKNRISFFDSYGLKEDAELNYLPFYLDQGGKPHLTRLINNALSSGYTIDYNKFHLQASKTDTSTCGMWAVSRLRMRNLSHEQFFKLFTENKQEIKPDDLLVLMNYFGFYEKIAV